jgi:hypothetical protein
MPCGHRSEPDLGARPMSRRARRAAMTRHARRAAGLVITVLALSSLSAATTTLAAGSAPTLLWTTGFEAGTASVAGGGILSQTTGAVGVDSAVQRTGAYSLKVAPAGAGATGTRNLSGTPATVVVRFALYLDALPSQSVNLFSVGTNSGSAAFLRYVSAARALGMRFGSNAIQNATGSIAPATWYIVEARVTYGSNPRLIDWRVNGVDEPQVTLPQTAGAAVNVQWGDGGAVTYTEHVDDIAVSATSSDYPLGDGAVVPLRPNAVGVHVGASNFRSTSNDGATWTPLSGTDTTTWQLLGDWPPKNGSDADSVDQSVPSTSSYLEYALSDTTSSVNANGISVLLAVRSEGTSTSQQSAAVTDDGTSTSPIFTNFNAASTGVLYKSATVSRRPSDGLPWSPSSIDNLRVRWGNSGVANPQPRLDAVLVEADFPRASVQSADTTPPTVGTVNAPSAVTASGFTLSWTAASDNSGIAGYQIDVATDSGFDAFVAGHQSLSVGNTLTATISGLSPATTYWARVRAVDVAGNVSSNSNVVSTTTSAADTGVNDDFSRTLTGGWGSTTGFTWSVDSAYAGDFSVDGSEGLVNESALGSRTASLAIGRRDVSVLTKFRLTTLPTGGWQAVYALARVNGTSAWYGLRVRSVAGAADDLEFNANSSTAGLVKVGAGTTVPELAGGSWYWLRFEAVGDGTTTILHGRLWPDGAAEPTTWTLTAPDATAALQGAAGVGVRVTSSSTSQPATVQVDSFSAAPPPPPSPPTNTSPPTILGLGEVGQPLTATPGTWSGTDGPISYAYQWRRCDAEAQNCGNIAGATGPTYTLPSADVDSTVRAVVTASDSAGTTTATSAATGVVDTDPVIAAAGDIACDPNDTRFAGGLGTASACHEKATSDILVANGALAAILPLGDNQYDCGSSDDFLSSFDRTWGSVKSLLRPVPGNHEYNATNPDPYGVSDCTTGASGYYSYFGAAAGDPTKGYYSFDVGSWHIIALNSECYAVGGCGVGSPEESWLRADLAAHPTACMLAYWHRPRFSSGKSGGDTTYDAFWQDLYAAGAEIVLNGHDHDYERFAPQNPAGASDEQRGIREFVVGTGGKEHYGFVSLAPNSEVRNSDTFGVLELALDANGYRWQFIPEAGATFTDSGSAACH